MICVASQMMFSPWIRTGTSPEEFKRMNHGSLCSLSGRFTSCSSHLRAFSAIAKRTCNGIIGVTAEAPLPGRPSPVYGSPPAVPPLLARTLPSLPPTARRRQQGLRHRTAPHGTAPPAPRRGHQGLAGHGPATAAAAPLTSPSVRRRTASSGTAPAAPWPRPAARRDTAGRAALCRAGRGGAGACRGPQQPP